VDLFSGEGAITKHWGLDPSWLSDDQVATHHKIAPAEPIEIVRSAKLQNAISLECPSSCVEVLKGFQLMQFRESYDVLHGRSFDLSTPPSTQCGICRFLEFKFIGDLLDLRLGFKTAMALTLRLRPGSLLCLGPPCSFFIFINLGTSCRTEQEPYGDRSLPHVVLGNMLLGFVHSSVCVVNCTKLKKCSMKNSSWHIPMRLLARACILCLIATVRGAYFTLEQPMSSYARHFPPLKKIVHDIDLYITPCYERVFLPLV